MGTRPQKGTAGHSDASEQAGGVSIPDLAPQPTASPRNSAQAPKRFELCLSRNWWRDLRGYSYGMDKPSSVSR